MVYALFKSAVETGMNSERAANELQLRFVEDLRNHFLEAGDRSIHLGVNHPQSLDTLLSSWPVREAQTQELEDQVSLGNPGVQGQFDFVA